MARKNPSSVNRKSWAEQLAVLRKEIVGMPDGVEREAATKRAAQLAAAVDLQSRLRIDKSSHEPMDR